MSKKWNKHRIWRYVKTYIIFAIAVLAFVILGMFQGDGLLSSGGMAAMVNGEVISLAQFSQTVQRLEERMGFNSGSMPANQRASFTNYIKQQAMSNLISVSLLSQGADKQGIFAPDNQVMDYIVNIEPFQEDGQFSPEIYNNYLKSNRLKASDFEDERRREIVINRIQELFDKTLTESDIEKQLKKQAEAVALNIEFVKFKSSELSAKASEKQAEDYAANAENDKAIADYYSLKKKAEFTKKESVRARHILVKIDAKNKDSEKQAKARIEKIQERLKAEPFETVAKEVSEDQGSAVKGGDLGTFERGRMVQEFEDKAFTMQVGQVSDPVKSSFGFHIIKLEEKNPQVVEELEQAKASIAKKLVLKQLRKEKVTTLKGYLKDKKTSSVSGWVKSNGLKWEKTGEFKLSDGTVPKLGNEELVVAEAFKLKPRQMSSAVVQSGGYTYIVKLAKMGKAKSVAKKPNALPNPKAGAQASQQALGNWIKQMQDNSKIKTNEKVIAGK